MCVHFQKYQAKKKKKKKKKKHTINPHLVQSPLDHKVSVYAAKSNI